MNSVELHDLTRLGLALSEYATVSERRSALQTKEQLAAFARNHGHDVGSVRPEGCFPSWTMRGDRRYEFRGEIRGLKGLYREVAEDEGWWIPLADAWRYHDRNAAKLRDFQQALVCALGQGRNTAEDRVLFETYEALGYIKIPDIVWEGINGRRGAVKKGNQE